MLIGKSEKAFTMIEVMIVVVIIGLIMMIALPNYLEARANAITTVCCSNQKMIFAAAVIYGLSETNSLESVDSDKRLQELINKEYLKSGTWGNCPKSSGSDNNDYTIIFEDGVAVDIECKIDPTSHRWP